ncbi:MAG: hypothetical protein WAM91_17170 [Candidatus Acidiferrales bacterium]
MPNEIDLVPPGTRVEANGEGAAVDISGSATKTFLCLLEITGQIEQESLDVSVWGSSDGRNWGAKPIIKLPQSFYRGEARMVLDLALRSEIKYIRPQWELNRWGRVAPLPMFVFNLRAVEIPAMPHSEAAKAAAVLP